MIRLTVQTYNGAPVPQSLSAQFDELGGTVGRADNNQLVLPDPERSISRVHAQVVFRNGSFGIIDRGSNPVLINGRPLGNGVEGPIKHGDQLQIGGYLIAVEAADTRGAASSQADPFGDPFADLGGGAAFGAPAHAPMAPPVAHQAAPAAPAMGGVGQVATFSLDAFGAPSSSGKDPFGFGGGMGTGMGAASGGAAAPAAGGIPDDWDPFAPEPASKSAPDLARSLGGSPLGLDVGAAAPAPLIPGMGDLGGGKANTSSSIDAMFGLSPAGADPLANSILAPAAVAPNMANHVDPMRSLNSVSAGSSTVAPDNVSALSQPFMEAPLQRAASPAQPASTKSAVLSWDDGGGAAERTVIRSSAAARARAAAAASGEVPTVKAPAAAQPSALFDQTITAAPTGMVSTPAAMPASAPAAAVDLNLHMPAAAPAASGAAVPPATVQAVATDHVALLTAFKEGAGMPGLNVPLTPEFMRLLGQLLNEAAGGTVDLLVARQTLKREVQAEMTMISSKGNNPLKFSPSAEVALNYLLNPPARGFMPGQQAMRDAYNDLRAHQVAFVAGVRSALEGVLKRFDPAVLESKLTQKSMLSTLLPASRKAKMWDVFTELYGQISAEADEDFHELFGEEFKRAYDEHIRQLKRNG